jgi:hypothetical protein
MNRGTDVVVIAAGARADGRVDQIVLGGGPPV